MRRTRLVSLVLGLGLAVLPSLLRAEPVVTGVVLDEAGRPLAGVQVELVTVQPLFAADRDRWQGEVRPAAAVTETTLDGRFRLPAPTAGAYEVLAHAGDRAPVRLGPFVLTRAVELPAARPPLASSIVLRVIDGEGLPLAGVWVRAWPPAEATRPEPRRKTRRLEWRPEERIAQVTADGAAFLPVLAGERLEVEVLVPGQLPPRRTAVADGVVRLPGRVHRPGGEKPPATALRFALADGAPATGVLLHSAAAGWPLGLADEQGRLTVVLPRGASGPTVALGAGRPPQLVRLANPDAAGTPGTVTLAPLLAASGRVLDGRTGQGLPGVLVAPVADLGALTATTEQGRFTLPILAGELLALEAHRAGYLPRRLTIRPEQIVAGRLPAIALEPAARVVGRVLALDGRPLGGATVEAIPTVGLGERPFSPAEPVADRAASGTDGGFELAGLQGGSGYELRASQAGWLPAAVPVAAAPPQGKTPLVEIRLQPVRPAVGQVVDADGRPLAGALVVLRPSRRLGRGLPPRVIESPPAAGDPATAASGADGRFVVPTCPAALLDAEARLAGYAPAVRVGFRAGPETGPLDLGTLVLLPGARLAGKVIDDRKRPVQGAQIFLFNPLSRSPDPASWVEGEKPDATSGSDGGFLLADLRAGVPRDLVVTAEGFLPTHVRNARPRDAGPLIIELQAGMQLAGRVIDEADQPIAGAEVSLSSQPVEPDDPYQRRRGRPLWRTAGTDAAGRFAVLAVAGRGTLSVAADGFVPAQEIAVELPASGRPQPLEVRLHRGAVLWGKVANTRGDAIAGARVVTDTAAATSDAEGAYRMTGVAEGGQAVLVQAPDYRRLERQVTVEPGENHLDLELPAGVAVEGRVLEGSGDPVGGAEIELQPVDRAILQAQRTRSDGAGQFRFEPVAAGNYYLHATAADHRQGDLPSPLTVAQEPLRDLEVRLRSGARLSGQILGLSADDLAAVTLRAHANSGPIVGGQVNADGTYEVGPLAAGGWSVQALLWQGQREAGLRLQVAPADRELRRDLEFSRGLTLAGRVTFDDEPLPDATLTLRGQGLATERTVLTGFDGGFRLEDLEPDTYWLGVSEPYRWITHNQMLELAADRELEIRLASAAVSGRVRDAQSGEGIRDAQLRLQPVEGPEFLIADSSREDGGFYLLHVPPGTFRLAASADGFAGAEQQVHVAAGEVLDGIDLALQPTAGTVLAVALAAGGAPAFVHLQARDADGNPILAETRGVDGEGYVRLATLPPGTWQLLVSAPGAAMVATTVVVPGETVPVSLPPAGRVRLRVPDLAESDRLATVTVLAADQQPLAVLGPGGQLASRWPVMAGEARIDGVPGGVWRFQVEATDGRVWSAILDVPGSGETPVILDASGSPDRTGNHDAPR